VELSHYKSVAKDAFVKLKSIDPHIDFNMQCVGHQSHFIHVKDRLEFLDYTLLHSSLMLSKEQLDIFWSCLIVDALTHEEREQAFQWLETSRGASRVTDVKSSLFIFL
jgi:hypothetical protein